MLANENVRNCWSLLLSTRVLGRKDYQKPGLMGVVFLFSMLLYLMQWQLQVDCWKAQSLCRRLVPKQWIEILLIWRTKTTVIWLIRWFRSIVFCGSVPRLGKASLVEFHGRGRCPATTPASAALSTITICCFWENFRSGNWKIWAQIVERLLDG